MSTLGLVGVVLAAVVVAVVAGGSAVRRRRAGAGPRTVADLVRLRAEQAAARPDPAPPVPERDVAVPAPVAPASSSVPAGPAVGVAPGADEVIHAGESPSAEPTRSGPRSAAVSPEATSLDVAGSDVAGSDVAGSGPAAVPDSGAEQPPVMGSADTPWGRAQQMSGAGTQAATSQAATPHASTSGGGLRPAPSPPEPIPAPAPAPASRVASTRTSASIPAPAPTPALAAALALAPATVPASPSRAAVPEREEGLAAAPRPVPVLRSVQEPRSLPTRRTAPEPRSVPEPAAEPDPVRPAVPAESRAVPAESTAVRAESTAALVEIPASRGASPVKPGRRSTAETEAEQAAADVALLRTFGFPNPRRDCTPVISFVGADGPGTPDADRPGASQQIRFHAVRRDGSAVPGAGVTLLDDRGRETSRGTADAHGRGVLSAPHPGGYVLVSTAPDHQPGAVAVSVSDRPADAEVLLTRSASLSGSVRSAAGPIVGARVTLVQDGEIVDAVDSGPGGVFRIVELGAGEYGLSVVAVDCEPAAVLLDVPDGVDVHRDVGLDAAGREPAGADDLLIGHR